MNKNRIAIILCLVMILSVLVRAYAQGQAPPFPPLPLPGEYIRDTLNWLSPAQAQQINSVAGKLDSDGLSVLAVVTLDDCGPDKFTYKVDLFRAWKIGHAATNDGLLILVCWYGGNKSQRSLEQVTGTGLEAAVTDIQTSRMREQYFVPAFQGDTDPVASGRAGQGLVDLVKAYDALLRGNTMPAASQPLPTPTRNIPVGQPPPDASPASAIVFLVLIGAVVLLIVGLVANAFIRSVKSKKKRTRIWAVIALIYVIGTCILATIDIFAAVVAGGAGVLILIIFIILPTSHRGGSRDRSFWDSSSSDDHSDHDSSRSDMGGGNTEGGGSSGKF